MNIRAVKGNILQEKCDALVLGVFSGTQGYAGIVRAIDRVLDGLLTTVTADEQFGGKEGEAISVHTHGKVPAERVLIVGMGDRKTASTESIRRALGTTVKNIQRFGAKQICMPLVGMGVNGMSAQDAAQALVEGALLADYRYLVFKPSEAKRALKHGIMTLTIIEPDQKVVHQAERGIGLGDMHVRATVYARDLVNEPASRMTPTHLRDHAIKIAKHADGITLKVYDKAACEKMGMGAYLSVARGSEEPPYFLHLVYKPQKRSKTKVALIGKGITFDSGGLSLKPSDSMETMKCDMAGAAAVLGVFSVLSDLKPDGEVHGLIAATENMPSGKASKPGDIVTAMNGKSIEIFNTDAEGRLALADCLSYAVKRIKPDVMVDLATLTGACMVALGPDIAAVLGTNAKLCDELIRASEKSGESLWKLPLPVEYQSFIHGEHADVRNTSRVRGGGAITAGLFLREFAGDVPWAHVDIAGPAFIERESRSYIPKGGSGFGVRTLLNFLRS